MKGKTGVIISVAVLCVVLLVWNSVPQASEETHLTGEHGDNMPEKEIQRGVHGGKLLVAEGLSLEITIYERGVPPEFHVYAYSDGQVLNPDEVKLDIRLQRLGDVIDQIGFKAEEDYLKGDTVVYEPHSFEVIVAARYKNRDYHWRYDNFEGRTVIPSEMAEKMGIVSESVGAAIITETRTLTGLVHTDPNRLSRVRARFSGIVQSVKKEIGETVRAGEVLATVQSNESLQTYQVRAPIAGSIIRRDIQVGEATGIEPLFIIADLSRVWIELDVFNRDLSVIKTGQSVVIESLGSEESYHGVIDWISPLAAHASQSVHARIQMDNRLMKLRPGQFVRGHVTIAEHKVDMAVRQSAIQGFRDFKVVYARFGDTYEVRMLELGRSNREWIEVLGGIVPGVSYVTQNSYLIKADIEKTGASHDH